MPLGIYKRTEEHNRKIGLALKGRIISQEWRDKISQTLKNKGILPPSRKGAKQSPEAIAKTAEANRGRPKPKNDEHRKKISEAQKGRQLTEEHKRNIAVGSKRHYLMHPDRRQKVSERHSGEGCHWWKGGISYSQYGRKFNNTLKHFIRERDSFVCQICFKNGWIVHHIDYDKRNNDVTNLTTVCRKCHGFTNGSRDEWQEYFDLRDRLRIGL